MNRRFNAGLVATGLATILATGAFATPLAFEFQQDGYFEDSIGNVNGVLSGFFVGEDLNEDGIISARNGEVLQFGADYTSDQFDTSFSYVNTGEVEEDGFFNAFELVYHLNEAGFIGDDTSDGEVFDPGENEQIRASNDDFRLRAGNPFFGACSPGADFACGVISTNDNEGDGPPIAVFDAAANVEPVEFVEHFSFNSIEITSDPLGEEIGTEDNPFLPNLVDDDGGFVFDLNPEFIPPAEIFWIDPEIAVGYTYEIVGAEFDAVQLPSLGSVPDADGQYLLSFNGKDEIVNSGQLFLFTEMVTEFTITGIDVGLALDPNDPLAFTTGVAYRNQDQFSFTITQTPITINTDLAPVPLPAGGLLLLSGLAGIGFMRRRNKS